MSLHKQFTLSRLELTALGKNIRYLKSDIYKDIFFFQFSCFCTFKIMGERKSGGYSCVL